MSRDYRPLPNIILIISICVFGIFGNSMIILATITSKKLRGRCNALICMLAVSDLFCCVYLIHLRVMMLCGSYIQKSDSCYWHSIYGLLALNAGSALGLILGIDRFLAVFWPIRYANISRLPYAVMLVAMATYSAILTFLGFTSEIGDRIPFCIPPFAYNAKSRAIYVDCTFAVSFIVIIIYGAANLKFRSFIKHLHPSANTLNIEAKRRMLISLSLLMAIYTTTQFATFVTLISSQIFPILNDYIDLIYHYLGVLMALNVSSNFVIYWWRNTEYRKVFVQLLRHFKKQNAIFVTNTNTTNLVQIF